MKKHNNSCLQVLQKALKMDDCQKNRPNFAPRDPTAAFTPWHTTSPTPEGSESSDSALPPGVKAEHLPYSPQ